ncbi:MAG: alpha/beta hydrolase [Actinomycetota bacterium]
MVVEVDNARLWVEVEGDGPPVVFLHGGLGDTRLWSPVVERLRDSFRCIRFDFRFYGRSEADEVEWSHDDDVVAVLDALGIERAALVGLSMGGRVALETALRHPERVAAVVHVAGAVRPFDLDPAIEERYDAVTTPDEEMVVDLMLWAPLGADAEIRELWQATPEAKGIAWQPTRPEPEFDRLAAPVYVLTAAHDPAPFRALAATLPAVESVELDSDHYLTLREPDRVAELIRGWLG